MKTNEKPTRTLNCINPDELREALRYCKAKDSILSLVELSPEILAPYGQNDGHDITNERTWPKRVIELLEQEIVILSLGWHSLFTQISSCSVFKVHEYWSSHPRKLRRVVCALAIFPGMSPNKDFLLQKMEDLNEIFDPAKEGEERVADAMNTLVLASRGRIRTANLPGGKIDFGILKQLGQLEEREGGLVFSSQGKPSINFSRK